VPSPLSAGEGSIQTVDPGVEADQVSRLEAWRASRNAKDVAAALDALDQAARSGANIMPASILAAKAGVTTGEWSACLRRVFGEYRAPTGVGRVSSGSAEGELAPIRAQVNEVSKSLGRRLKILIGKPGLDGHSNGAEQIAVRARDCGFEVVYEGIRLTPAEIVNAALEEGVHVIGLSILSGSHVALVGDVMKRLHENGLSDIPVIVGGIIPPEDERQLLASGVAAVFTPKNYQINDIMARIVSLVAERPNRAA
jgi:(2R)-ethylmalonyl-CoA mutase